MRESKREKKSKRNELKRERQKFKGKQAKRNKERMSKRKRWRGREKKRYFILFAGVNDGCRGEFESYFCVKKLGCKLFFFKA